MSENNARTKVLILGASGQIGGKVASLLEQSQDVDVRITTRRRDEIEGLKNTGKDIVYLDLNDPRTFGAALAGVERVFLLTGYTVAMLAQSKTLVDAAVKAGVKHIVHLGVFAEWDCTDPHFGWHQLVECYIKASGIAWTHLHPNMFMENLLQLFDSKNDAISTYWGTQRTGWISTSDIAAVAATALREGQQKHHGKDYWLSAEVANGPELATILSDATGRRITCNILQPEDFAAVFTAMSIEVERWYADSGVESMRQIVDGRMGSIGSVRNDVAHVIGRPAVTLREWASKNL